MTEEGDEPSHVERLRPQGKDLIETMRAQRNLTLIFDECHHLLDTWGELVAEILRELPDAVVIGLTATPPGELTTTEADLVEELFGEPILGPSTPAVVRSGYLAPYAELAWFAQPTKHEAEWLAAEAEHSAPQKPSNTSSSAHTCRA